MVGGGGLVQLPALLIGLPADTPPAAILGTNKLSSVWGTATSSVTYALKVRPDWRTVLPLVVGRRPLGSAAGAQLAKFLPKEYFTPIVLVALVGVGIYTWRRPQLGLVIAAQARRPGPLRADGGHRRSASARTTASSVRAPGSFFVILLVGVLGYGFLEASAKAKIANLVTNLSAIAVFAAHGTVLWALGLPMGAANLVGGFLGARTAIARGRQRLRPQGLPASSSPRSSSSWPTTPSASSAEVRRAQSGQPGQARSGAPQAVAVAAVPVRASSAAVRSAGRAAAASHIPTKGSSRVSIRRSSSRASSASRASGSGS